MWWKVDRKTFQKVKKEMSMKLGNSVIVRPWSEYTGHHHIKEPWSPSELGCREIKGTSPQHDLLIEEWRFSQNSVTNSFLEMEKRRG